jgi:hypothetical protein
MGVEGKAGRLTYADSQDRTGRVSIINPMLRRSSEAAIEAYKVLSRVTDHSRKLENTWNTTVWKSINCHRLFTFIA